jgi:hypothetical protein
LKDPAADLRRAISVLAGAGDHGLLRLADALTIWIEGNDSLKLEDALGVAANWRSAMRRRRSSFSGMSPIWILLANQAKGAMSRGSSSHPRPLKRWGDLRGSPFFIG